MHGFNSDSCTRWSSSTNSLEVGALVPLVGTGVRVSLKARLGLHRSDNLMMTVNRNADGKSLLGGALTPQPYSQRYYR